MTVSRPMFPQLGIRPPSDGRPHVLIVEQIRPGCPEMVYAPIGWWQQLSSCAISVVNVWPPETFGGIPDGIELTDFDAVILFPRIAYDPVALHMLDRRLPTKFAGYDGVKVLMRQDENVMTRSIEDFVISNGFDALITCVPEDQLDVAYPRLSAHSVTALSVLTGYITPDMRAVSRAPYDERSIDLSYRAYRGGLAGGRLVHEKAEIGTLAIDRFAESGLALDISLDPKDRLTGSDWRRFLNDSKAVLGTESGSNLFDFTGDVYRWAALFEFAHRDADFELDDLYERGRGFLDQFEGNVDYAQVSPRHFEAAAFGALQVMWPGRYSDIFHAGQHFVELQKDFSNADDVVEAIRDRALHAEMTSRAVEEIIENPDLWIESAIGRLDAAVTELIESRPRSAGRMQRRTVGSAAAPSPTPRSGGVSGLVHIVNAVSTELPGSLAGRGFDTSMLRVVIGEEERTVVVDGIEPITVSVGAASSAPSAGFDRSEVPSLAASFDRLTRAAQSSPSEILHDLGGYSDRHGSPDGFRADCRRALGLADEAFAWVARGLIPDVVVVSDAVALLAAGVVSSLAKAQLIVDYETINGALAWMHGWQVVFWEEIAVEIVNGVSTAIVAASTAQGLTASRSLFAHPRVAEATSLAGRFQGFDVRGRSGGPAATFGEVEWVFTGGRSREPLTSLSDMRAEVLPLVEGTFGVESLRFWNIVRDASEDFRRAGRFGDAKDLLDHALDRYVDAAQRSVNDAALQDLLAQRRSLLVRLFASAQSELSDEQAQSLAGRVVNGEIPITADNRRSMWALAVRLRSGTLRDVHEQLVDLLDETADDNADRVFGLLNLLAHDWSIEDHESARPIAFQLEDLAANDDAVRLDQNVLARMRIVLDATGGPVRSATDRPREPFAVDDVVSDA